MYTLSNSTDDVGYAMAIDQMEGGRYGAQARCRSLSGTPCLAALPPLGHARYVTEEFIVEGTANAFRPARPLTEDGLWSVEQGERASYATRLVVCRPAAIEIGRASCRGRVGERGAAVPSSEKYNRMS